MQPPSRIFLFYNHFSRLDQSLFPNGNHGRQTAQKANWQFCLFVFGKNDWCTFCCQPKQKSALLASFHHRAAIVSIINILAGSTGQGSDNSALFNSLEINSYFLKTFKVTPYPRNIDFMLVPSLTSEKLVSRHDPN